MTPRPYVIVRGNFGRMGASDVAEVSTVRAPTMAPTPAPAPAPADSISARVWLTEMREMRHEQQRERKEQTDAFVAALDTLGGKLDTNMAAMRQELRRHLNVLMLTFVLAFVVLAGLAGVGIYVKGFGITAQNAPDGAPPASATPPTPDAP